jgi:hypothetical protein
MGAAVEAQLDASTSEAGTRLLGEWVEVHQSVLLRCSSAAVAAVDQGPPSYEEDGEGSLSRVMLQCLVFAAREAALDVAHLAGAVRAAEAGLLARFSPAHGAARLSGSTFTRCFYDKQSGLDARNLERALRQGSGDGGESGGTEVLALLVERIGHGGAQVALQMHLGVVAT